MSSPLSSMTGFARTDGSLEGVAWAWELRSVNGRGLDLKFRLPAGLDALEPALREAAGQQLRRGNVTANCTLRREERPRLVADPASLAQVMALALDLAQRIPGAPPPTAEGLLALPGVLRAATAGEEEALTEAHRAAVREGFIAALGQLVQARCAEGSRLATILAGQLAEISALHVQAKEQAAEQPAAQRVRLQESLAQLLRGADIQHDRLPEDRLAQEVALLAARSDVREELDRLDSHIQAARALLAEGAQVGRRFDFLVQEFVRETNTLCAKSASIALTATGLRLKATIEQLREQVQNVE
ncbi:MAG: YicC/YloC family endoribonuclease [Acetobacteraceae bacterium]